MMKFLSSRYAFSSEICSLSCAFFYQDKIGRREMDAAKCQTVFLSEYVLSAITNAAKLAKVGFL